MSLFNRKSKISTEAPSMPPELNKYYQAEKRQQTVVTWILGFATLAVTIALAFLLFFGARWVVNKVRNKPAASPETSQQEDNEDDDSGTATTTPAEQPTPSAAGQATNGAGTTTPQTSSATTSLPSTGPTETVAVFFVATTVGMFAYQLSSRRSQI